MRRRNKNDQARERQRISGDLGKVQAKLNAYKARLLVEDPSVGKLYATLVSETRLGAGGYIKQAWDEPPVADGSDIHARQYDFSLLDEPDNAHLHGVADHLSWFPWYRRLRRRRASS